MQWECNNSSHQCTVPCLIWSTEYNLVPNINTEKSYIMLGQYTKI